ncbi:calcineurin-like phosphoesterase [Anaeromyces robustus]|uniref:Calcineurin-like phosphoesterase n=1 Tax=Anaeromyces robustus TaxID=1754192 RepID=A0A1Y1XNR4_9FUNG|nr:calcineurin-like phosphoesterase [Anaeromyces robustus]|eukprot:ORX87371.1 calcineurin-like phosphoesterase [Anaeromyces robustus]
MKIQYASDLHLEFECNLNFIKENPLIVKGDILILAGDTGIIGTESFDPKQNPFWEWASKNYKQVLVALGNHEFYNNYDLSTIKDGFVGEILENVHYYYNCVVTIEDVDIIISTLWTNIGKKNSDMIRMKVNDFKKIHYGENRLITVEEFNQEHERCLNFITKSIKESSSKKKGQKYIIVTHHVPSKKLNPPEFKGSNLNEAFTVDITNIIKKSGAKYWIFGHSHRNVDKEIGKTKCVSNQFGYIFTNEHITFNREKFFEI